MSGVKHTPWPWITFQPRGDGGVPVRTDGLGLTICYVYDGAICDAIANACLIAAAPDLLEACLWLKSYAEVQVRRHPRAPDTPGSGNHFLMPSPAPVVNNDPAAIFHARLHQRLRGGYAGDRAGGYVWGGR